MTRTVTPDTTRSQSANARLKARWSRYLMVSWSVALSVHVAAFALLPRWSVSVPETDRVVWEGVSLVALPPLDALSAETGAPVAPLPVASEDEEDATSDGTEDGAVVSDEQVRTVDLWDAIGERLRRRGALVPALAEPEEETEASTEMDEDGNGDGGDEETRPARAARTTELDELPEPGEMDLDRLANVRPELALQLPSAWVLIRNPVEVETFLRRGYREGALDPDATGKVSVTLWIDQRGSVEWAEISESSGHRELDEYALALFNEVAAFRAAREGGVSVSRSVTLSVSFPW